MPLTHAHLVDGPTVEQRRAFMRAVTEAACTSLGVSTQSERVWLTPVDAEDFMVSGTTVADPRTAAQSSRGEGRDAAR